VYLIALAVSSFLGAFARRRMALFVLSGAQSLFCSRTAGGQTFGNRNVLLRPVIRWFFALVHSKASPLGETVSALQLVPIQFVRCDVDLSTATAGRGYEGVTARCEGRRDCGEQAVVVETMSHTIDRNGGRSGFAVSHLLSRAAGFRNNLFRLFFRCYFAFFSTLLHIAKYLSYVGVSIFFFVLHQLFIPTAPVSEPQFDVSWQKLWVEGRNATNVALGAIRIVRASWRRYGAERLRQ
jgi:hypothetical protein